MDEQRLDKAKADGSNPFPTTKHTMTFTIEELIEKAGNIEITEEHIAAMEKRLHEVGAEYVKEMKEKTVPWDWYHQIVG